MTRALILVAILTFPAAAHAFKLMRTVEGAPVHWAATSVTVVIDPSAPSRSVPVQAVRQALANAVAAWSRLPEVPVRLQVAGAPSSGGGLAVLRFVGAAWPFQADRVANTRFVADRETGVARESFIDLNEEHFQFYVGIAESTSNAHDLEAVLVHEIGHLLGLDHSAVPASAMQASGQARPGLRPGDDDRAGLLALYPRPESRPEGVSLVATETPPRVGAAPERTPCTRALPDTRDHRVYVVGPCAELEAEEARSARRRRGARAVAQAAATSP